jgi:hypothetical protein
MREARCDWRFLAIGDWRLAIGDWRLAIGKHGLLALALAVIIGDWRLLAAVCCLVSVSGVGCCTAAVAVRWLLVVGCCKSRKLQV